VRLGDRLYDRKAEPMPSCGPNSFGSDLLERLEQPVHLLRPDDRACVADEQVRSPPDGPCDNFDCSSPGVMAQRVINEVRHQALDQSRVTDDLCPGELGLNVKISTPCLLGSRDEYMLGEIRQIGLLPHFETAFARREGEEGVDEPLLLTTELQGLLASCPQFRRSGVGVRESNLQERALTCERSSQFVRGVRNKVAL
jgi:hypothetical protein